MEADPPVTDTAVGDSIDVEAVRITRHLACRVKGSPPELYAAARHLIENGGKRLRPYMMLRSCQILGGSMNATHKAVSAIEMIHNFSLVHDDIMDNDELRHGVPTVHKKYGTPVAILAGDVLFSKAYQVLTAVRERELLPDLVTKLADVCVDICEGQMLDIQMAQEERIPTQEEYITMIRNKTAALFEASCAMGAICARTSNKSDVRYLSLFGRHLGVAFQITDDLIGVAGDPAKTKKPVGNDIKEGKKSLPILMALKESAGTKHHEPITAAFGNPDISRQGLDGAVESIRALGIEETVSSIACGYADKAKRCIAAYPDSRAKDELMSLLGFVVKRDN